MGKSPLSGNCVLLLTLRRSVTAFGGECKSSRTGIEEECDGPAWIGYHGGMDVLSSIRISALTALLFGTFVGAWGQVQPPAPAGDARAVSFAKDVHAILAERCFKCHGGEEKRGGLSMVSREALLAGGEFGPAVKVGDAANSLLIELVTSEDPEERMPNKGDPLRPEQIAILRAWIDEGLNWDLTGPLVQAWTPPLAPRTVAVPDVKGIHGSKEAIDRLIAVYFADHKIETPALVDDRTFARRAYLDLIGLLPTEQELADFESSRKRDKREQLVNSLLADRRSYTEHWMTFWNDTLRNDFQGTGYIDGGREQITGWLYSSLHDNKPYDVFTRELVSGTGGSAGFIKGIVWRGAATANQSAPMQAARNVSQVFMGVNLKCASCHDSFVSEWKLADAYGLASAFSDAPLELVRCDVPQGKTAELRFLFPELGTIDAAAPLPDRQARVAELVIARENGRFARMAVNRVWGALMGRGLSEPTDVLENPPWSDDLLDWLASDFAENEYDLQRLLAQIATSAAYQLTSNTSIEGEGGYFFRGPAVRRISAEQFYDAMSRVTGVWQAGPKYEPAPEEGSFSEGTVRAWRVPADDLALVLGRPNREMVTLRRPLEYSRLQAIELTNGETLAKFLAKGAANLESSLPEDPIRALYIRALQREPSAAERQLVADAGLDPAKPEDLQDFLWSLFMHPEFQLIY